MLPRMLLEVKEVQNEVNIMLISAARCWKTFRHHFLSVQNDQIRTAVEEYGDYNVFTLDYPRPNEPTVHIVDHEN